VALSPTKLAHGASARITVEKNIKFLIGNITKRFVQTIHLPSKKVLAAITCFRVCLQFTSLKQPDTLHRTSSCLLRAFSRNMSSVGNE